MEHEPLEPNRSIRHGDIFQRRTRNAEREKRRRSSGRARRDESIGRYETNDARRDGKYAPKRKVSPYAFIRTHERGLRNREWNLLICCVISQLPFKLLINLRIGSESKPAILSTRRWFPYIFRTRKNERKSYVITRDRALPFCVPNCINRLRGVRRM